ncbi:Lrp/AsnC family transcriptional regulator [Paenibacillus doosanensis]|uniref:HTH-type transcriptional regulator LrpC n=1 Tax=Paenibacillus konkukensis TaxID=2020716 RepID=A0ABY4RWV3_9BACL|nr:MULTISPECIES: Lrp/AsnC family transcriptional regulator [Paenibacillus]MCS7460283.1 Lrp/AsnC family transcriptional regulator [Paenibacillus doosanensis]UQZ86171.1 HTH-type transcriptional regulator LrpC [Paenibacillus konkukensis]
MPNQSSIDEVDLRILNCLLQDATLSHKAIGGLVHLTGQAVGSRIRKLQELGVIEGYTVRWNPDKIGQSVHAFVTVFMKSNTAHSSFQTFVRQAECIAETHRVSGEGCYWLRVRVASAAELNTFLDELLKYGNYKLSLSIGQIK